MRRGLFTKGRKERRRSNSDITPDEISNSWSTDPRDLPKGIAVGSMSVPYPPPYYVKKESEVQIRKESKGRKRRPKSVHHSAPSKSELSAPKSFFRRGHRRNASDTPPLEFIAVVNPPDPSPLTQGGADAPDYPTSIEEPPTVPPEQPVLVKVKLDDSPPPKGKVDVPPEKPARMKVKLNKSNDLKSGATAVDLRRSCSMDALNDIGARPEAKKGPSSRRTSLEDSPEGGRRSYNRWVSYNTPPAQQRTVVSLRSRLYKKPAKAESPPGSKKDSQNSLQRLKSRPKSLENLFEMIQAGLDVNALNEDGEAVIHTLLKKKRKHKLDLLLALLVNSDVDVNVQNRKGDTALHIAIEDGDEMCVKALVVFGADINKCGSNEFTPFDLCINNGHLPNVESLFMELGAKGSAQLLKETSPVKVPRMHSFAENMRPPKRNERLMPNDKIADFINKQGMRKLFQELQSNVDRRLSMSASNEVNMEEAFALYEQQRELAKYNKTLQQSQRHNTGFSLEGGSRILFLDGGGIKGLVQLEILMQIEEATGRTVVELFDWIVGTSTGGVIALALVYGKKNLKSLRQLYFKLKDRIFNKGRYGYGYDSEALDEILQEYLDSDIKMTDVSHPKVLIGAVYKKTSKPELHFFNNCFDDKYCDFAVWKVARYTSAAPMFFTEMDNYVDGGVICNNPTDYGLTRIQTFFRQQGLKLPIAVVVSVGSGRYPAEELGMVDAQEALYFGKQWLKPSNLIKKTQNLLTLLSNALVETEMVAVSSESRCQEQNIPFFRFSPQQDEIIDSGETDNEKLFKIVLQAKTETKGKKLAELVKLFHQIADASRSPCHGSIPEETIEEEEEPVSPPAVVISQEPPYQNGMEPETPIATSSPDRETERKNLNLELASKQEAVIEQSMLSDIQEESSSFSQASSEVLLATSPTHKPATKMSFTPTEEESALVQSAEGGTPTPQEINASMSTIEDTPTIETAADREPTDAEGNSLHSSSSESSLTQELTIDEINQPATDPPTSDRSPPQSPTAEQPLSTDREESPQVVINLIPSEGQTSLTASEPINPFEMSFGTHAREVEHELNSYLFTMVPSNSAQTDSQPDKDNTEVNMEDIGEQSSQEVVEPIPEPESDSNTAELETIPTEPPTEPEAECEPEPIPAAEPEPIPIEPAEPELIPNATGSESESESNPMEPEHSPVEDTSSPERTEPMLEQEPTLPQLTEEDTLPPFDETDDPTAAVEADPPGPLEQSMTTVAFGLIEQQCMRSIRDIETVRRDSLLPGDASQDYDELERQLSVAVNGHVSPDDLPCDSPAQINSVEPHELTPPLEDTHSEHSTSDSATPHMSLEPLQIPALHIPTQPEDLSPALTDESSPDPTQTVHPGPLSDEYIGPQDGYSSPSETGSPSYIEPALYKPILDGDEEGRENDFLISYQSFAKQHKVEDDKSKPTQKKASHFKLRTRNLGTKVKAQRETTI